MVYSFEFIDSYLPPGFHPQIDKRLFWSSKILLSGSIQNSPERFQFHYKDFKVLAASFLCISDGGYCRHVGNAKSRVADGFFKMPASFTDLASS